MSGPRRRLGLEHCVFNDCVHVALRVDTNKVPTETVRALKSIEQDAVAAGNPSGFLSKQQKRDLKDQLSRQIDDELRSGKHRRTKLYHVLWDVPAGVLYAPASLSVREKLTEIFSRTFNLELLPLTSGTIALRAAEKTGQRRAYEDLMPTRFARSNRDPDRPAEYPWTAKGDNAKDWLGNEFLLWLWHSIINADVPKSAAAVLQPIVMFDRTLQLDCVFGESGKDTFVGALPNLMPEARDALRQGKAPRRASLLVGAADGTYVVTVAAETLAVSALKLPEIDDADTPRTLFEERITRLRNFGCTLDGLFSTFLQDRLHGWEFKGNAIAKWIASTAQ